MSPSYAEATRTIRDLHRPLRDETLKNSNKAQEEELQFLRSKVKKPDKYAKSLTTFGATLENLQRWVDFMEAGDRSQAKVETGRGPAPEEVRYLDHTKLSDEKVMPRHLLMR